MNQLQIRSGKNEILTTMDGREFVDLVSGFGAVLLGHCCQPLIDRVQRQLEKAWSIARLNTPIVEEAASIVDEQVGKPHRLIQLCSSGSEATELALRIAAVATGRKSFVGFSRSMHGKSIATNALSWSNDFVDLRDFRTLPFVDVCDEVKILEQLSKTLFKGDVAGVFVEPIQATNGGHSATASFYRRLLELCRLNGTLCIMDEVLTGFYRSGAVSYVKERGIDPDVLIFGKAIANGFPIAAVMCHERISISSKMLPGSTFSDNPVAAAAVIATIDEMNRIDIAAKCSGVHDAVNSRLQNLGGSVALRGHGALWVLELGSAAQALVVQDYAFAQRVLVSANDRFVRLLPPATISPEHLNSALSVVADGCLRVPNV